MPLNLSVKNAEKLKEKFQKKIDELQTRIIEVDEFCEMVVNYKPVSEKQKVIKYYAEVGTVSGAATRMDDDGHKINERKWQAGDVSNIIQHESVEDPLHEKIKKTFGKDFSVIVKKFNRH